MSESNKPFVITDRRRFTSDGTARPDADPPSEHQERDEPAPVATLESTPAAAPPAASEPVEAADRHAEAVLEDQQDASLPPAPSPEQMEQSRLAFLATADRIDIAIRAANPGMERPPHMSFEQIVQSVYMQAILQRGGGTPEGQQPQVDLLGARQSIDMLGILAEKTQGNLSPEETRLVESAIFELRLAFLEITQALARSAAAKSSGAPRPGPAGPSIVR